VKVCGGDVDCGGGNLGDLNTVGISTLSLKVYLHNRYWNSTLSFKVERK